MPAITRQQRNATKAPTRTSASDGDVWSQLTDGLKVLLYGEAGTGKTTLWSTFPSPILALICSGGTSHGELKSIDPKDRHRITPRLVTSAATFGELLEGADDYATVVLDHASGLQDLVLKEVLGIDDVPISKFWGLASQQQYGQVTGQCKELIGRKLLNRQQNVVIVAHLRVFGGKDGDDGSGLLTPTVGASVMPQLGKWLNGACDYIVQSFLRPKMLERHIKTKDGKEIVQRSRVPGRVEYCLRVGPDPTYMTRFRKPRGSILPECVVDADYADIAALAAGEPLPDRPRG